MQDSILGYVLFVPVAIIVLLILAMVALEYTEQDPRNPIGTIPKVVLDHVENSTLVTVVSVGVHRYDSIHINYTVGEEDFFVNATNRYTLDTNISGQFFTLNITVITENDHYMYNCTVRVAIESPDSVYLWVQVEGDDEAERHRIPYTLLAEWRDMSEA
ncbi:MAG: hypothetical protein KAS77_02470 [Thermoplasmata archaeon]|nr:hypothetical protein [Thermoplasmata archaeon]